jgi:molybdopterin-containing oxidoreductase family iron-sulfur binding subunit
MNESNDIQALRTRLHGTRGRTFWRSLEEVAETPEFKEFLHREFPENASEWLDPVGRRRFLKLMGASMALAGVSACTRQPEEAIVPYVRQPEELIPGKPLFFASAMPFAGSGIGLLVESHEGRPTKIEGNPDHPSSLGATDLFAQASILGLYDPDRSQVLTHLGDVRPFEAFSTAIRQVLGAQQGSQGSGLRVLSETVASPTLGGQIDEFLGRFPRAKWIQWEPFGRHNVREGSRLAFGEYVDPKYSIERADVILSLDSDFLVTGSGALAYARAYSSRRRIEGDRAQRNRLYAVESSPTNTGTKADHRLLLRASEIAVFARAVAAQLGVAGVSGGLAPEAAQAWIAPLVKDLQNARGRSLVIAGEGQPAAVHALAHAMNDALGNVGNTVVYTQTVETHPMDQRAALAELVGEMNAGAVSLLIVLGGNPVYNAPSDLKFAEAMDKVPVRASLSQFHDETAALCHWHIPEAHFLEMWSDVRGHDGTVSIVQPLIAPLYDGRSVHEVVSVLSEAGVRSGYDIVRSYWMGQREAVPALPEPVPAGSLAPLPATTPVSAFEKDWRRWLHDGLIPDTAFPPRVVTLQGGAVGTAPAAAPAGLEVVIRPDPSVYDGRFVNNGWLQELPKWLTKLTWDNGALLSPGTADRLNLVSGDMVEIKQGTNTLRIPVWLSPGHAADTITIHLGYGRERAGRIGTGIGFSINALRTTAAPDILTGVQVTKTGDSYQLVSTQDHWSLEGRNLVRVATVEQFERDPNFVAKLEHQPLNGLSMFEPWKYTGYAWGMAIDQNVCTGCNACVVACQAENNVPVVGKAQVDNGREMHWLRIDRYYTGDLDNPETYHQPMPCQQCESAPCEVVCPVAATTHSDEGLNDMVYNRCVGTRYCSNNCPYKVRRFNFLLYSDWDTSTFKLARNPDVTVRSRGVMEKCTYCVQRINHARVTAKLEDRQIRDGEVLTACQSACPTQAIVFGDINDPNSAVSKLKASPLNYSLLAELNTRPRTTYLAIVRNPNTELEPDRPLDSEEEGH